MRKLMIPAALLVSAAVLTGCAVRATAPATSVVPPQTVVTAHTSDAEVERDWWRLFGDPALDGLIAEALAANRDLRAAGARVEAALALAGATRLNQLPVGGVTVGTTRQHISEMEAFGRTLPQRSFTLAQAGMAFGWEADVFARLRGRAAAAASDARASQMDARGIQVALVAQVAAAYFDVRGSQRDLELLTEMRTRTAELRQRTEVMIASGRVTRIDLLRVQQVDEGLQVEQARVGHLRERARLRLATLTGRTPEGWQVPDSRPVPFTATALAVGTVPALLERRPDIAAAQSRLVAAAQRAGVARADLLPRIEVNGALGLIAGSVGTLARGSAASWLIAPRVTWAFLDWPQLKRRIRAADALTDAALAEYEGAILRAVEDVQTTIDAYGAATAALQASERQSEAAADVSTIVNIQYREGMTDSLAAMLAQRDAIAGALAENRALFAHRQAIVAVYRALGGGWCAAGQADSCG